MISMLHKNGVMEIPLDPPPPTKQPSDMEYRLDWSGAMNSTPQWLKDAKFGIFFHWGPYCVPEYDCEWYSRNMYTTDHSANKFHVENYGPITQYGYKNLVNLFTGENFNADDWITLFARTGARYVVACAEHADGYSLWNSNVNPYNSMTYGLGFDAIQAVRAAAERADMKFAASMHHSWNFGWFCSTDPLADVYNTKNTMFYGDPLPYSSSWYYPPFIFPDEAFQHTWLAKLKEIVDKFLPDYIYLDSRVYIMKEECRLEFAEYYLNAARNAGKEAVFSYKANDFQAGSGFLDYERQWMKNIQNDFWQCDDTIIWESWGYISHGTFRTTDICIAQLADTVSKNGNYLLNVSPRKDGTYDDTTLSILRDIGEWLKVNGEAIYCSRHFVIFGEGPTEQLDRVTSLSQYIPFTAEDIRFTQKDGTLYAILMGWPESGIMSVKTLCAGGALQDTIRQITMLGDGNPLAFTQDSMALHVTLPQTQPCKYAFTLKIEF